MEKITFCKKKILIQISSYGEEQPEYLEKVITEFKKYKKDYNVDIILHTTHQYDGEDVYVKSYPMNIGITLTRQPLKYVLTKELDYDYYIYDENDMLITYKTFKEWVKQTEVMTDYYIIGLMRYELKEGDTKTKYLVDLPKIPNRTPAIKSTQTLNDKQYIEISNPHQGCWLLTQNQLKNFKNNDFKMQPNTLEDNASCFHYDDKWPGNTNGLQRLIPVDKIDSMLIHHLPDKYINTTNYKRYTIKELKDIIINI